MEEEYYKVTETSGFLSKITPTFGSITAKLKKVGPLLLLSISTLWVVYVIIAKKYHPVDNNTREKVNSNN